MMRGPQSRIDSIDERQQMARAKKGKGLGEDLSGLLVHLHHTSVFYLSNRIL
jgi:hypothetical protein